jgi:CRISPR-associated protein Cas2
MNRRHFLVSYDISDDKRRTSVFELLQANGDHAQFSVFLCQLNGTELAKLHAALQPMIDSSTDQVLILDLGRVDYGEPLPITAIGRPHLPPVRTMIV